MDELCEINYAQGSLGCKVRMVGSAMQGQKEKGLLGKSK